MCVQEEGEKKGCKMETDGAEKEVEHEKRDLANYLSPFSLITFDFFFLFPTFRPGCALVADALECFDTPERTVD